MNDMASQDDRITWKQTSVYIILSEAEYMAQLSPGLPFSCF